MIKTFLAAPRGWALAREDPLRPGGRLGPLCFFPCLGVHFSFFGFCRWLVDQTLRMEVALKAPLPGVSNLMIIICIRIIKNLKSRIFTFSSAFYY